MVLDRLFDVGAGDGPEIMGDRILTVPNVLSLIRLLVMPVVWFDITGDRPLRALLVLTALVATDWIDGYVARRFGQVTRLGKVLDPVSDRILIVIVVVALGAAGIAPWWALALVLARDVLVALAAGVLALQGHSPPDVTRTGKAATFGLMWVFPTLLGAEAIGGDVRDVLRIVCFVGLAAAIVLYYASAVQYARATLVRTRGPDG